MISQKDNLEPSPEVLKSQLPIKITGIVFWGTLLVGLILTLMQLKNFENEITRRHTLNTENLAYELSVMLSQATSDSVLLEKEKAITDLYRAYGFSGIVIDAFHSHIAFGDTGEGHTSIEFMLTALDQPQFKDQVKSVTAYYSDFKGEIADKRKNLLINMGLMFSAFGFVLQWILQRVLTRPFISMVFTAQRFAGGDLAARFDERRQDEFGYLGKFFNKALDYLLVQQEELRDALTRVRESETALYSEKERVEVTLHSIGDAVITTDDSGCIEYFNPVAERLTGYSLEQVQGEPLRDVMQLVNENTRKRVQNPIDQCLESGEVVELADHTLLLREDGEEVAIADSAAPIRDRGGDVIGAVMVFHDVGHARVLQRQLSYQAQHDALTGLYNRRQFELRLNEAIEEAREKHNQHAVCYLDLDQFKIVNDTCGHIAGDELLQQLAHLLMTRVRDTDVLARLGGDEFGVLLRYCSLDQARVIAEELRRTVRDFRFVYEEHSFEIGVSIGVVEVNAQTQNMTEIYSAADVACYTAKDAGRNRIHIYKPDDSELKARQGEMRWVSRIHKALDEDRFVLYCQPIISVSDVNLPHHFEILLRIRDSDGQLIPPMAFIPAAERYNLMPEIDRWVVSRVLEQVHSLPAAFKNTVWTINISGRSLGDDELLEFLLEAIEASPLSGDKLCFEITETAAIANLRRATRFMKRLKTLGCRFALDDFGSGLSSFAYLKNLPVDYLKIDGSFVRDMVSDPIDHAMVDAINKVGQVMKLETIAEFVETDEVLHALQALGVNYAQGYAIAKPEPLENLLARGPVAIADQKVG